MGNLFVNRGEFGGPYTSRLTFREEKHLWEETKAQRISKGTACHKCAVDNTECNCAKREFFRNLTENAIDKYIIVERVIRPANARQHT